MRGQIPRQRCIYILAETSVVLACGITICGITGAALFGSEYTSDVLNYTPGVWFGPIAVVSASLGVAALRSKTSHRKAMLTSFFVLSIITAVLAMISVIFNSLFADSALRTYWSDYVPESRKSAGVFLLLGAILSGTYGVIAIVSTALLCGYWCACCGGGDNVPTIVYIAKDDVENEDGQQTITLPKAVIKGSEARIVFLEKGGEQSSSANDVMNGPPGYTKLFNEAQ